MRVLALPLLAALLLATVAARADEPARDPMSLPPALRSAMAAAQAASAASAPGQQAPDNAIRQVVFSNGHGFVVVHGRRYGVGQQLDGARIERITEQAVWLREAGQVRREPLYGGVEKRTPAPVPQAQARPARPKTSKEQP
jgi:hypothetical protein